MNIKLLSVSGIQEAIISMYLSKRTLNDQILSDIEMEYYYNVDYDGTLKIYEHMTEEMHTYIDKLYKYGIEYGHTTLLRFIDFSFLTVDLHRGAQDDLDSHAWRMENRIVRASTRLAKFNNKEKSDYYKKKIISTEEVVEGLDNFPKKIITDDGEYIYNGHGYVLKEYENDQDVIRGLYRLSIPSNCIWKVSLPGLRHIYKMRGPDSHAHPELREMMGLLLEEIREKTPFEKFITS